MSLLHRLAREFEHEARTTRRHLERLPADRLSWRPHEKSYTAGQLGSHIVECVRWAEDIFSRDEIDIDPASFTPFAASSVGELLAAFDDAVERGGRAMHACSEAAIDQPWRLKLAGRVRFERPRADVLRDFTLSHLIHHRGQLTVYLRLLDVPVPGAYGPTADDQG